MEAETVDLLKGGCLCGAVRFQVDGRLGPLVYCHCSICRRSSGSAFSSNASVPARSFKILQGQEAVGEYESSEGYFRAFCSNCGSPVYGRSANAPDLRRVRLGTLDDSPSIRAAAHVWTSSKACWFEIEEGIEQFSEMPPRSYILPR